MSTKKPKLEKTASPVHPGRGRFITFEGGEGAGKTTLISLVAAELAARGYQVVVTREPGGSGLGDKIRSLLLEKDSSFSVGSKAELLLFLASRAQHLEEVIIPALKAGKIVLCDRFNDSTIAYQGGARGMGVDYVQNLCNSVCSGTAPDLTFYLDIDPRIGLARASKVSKSDTKSGQTDRIESEKLRFHENVRSAFLSLVRRFPERFQVLHALKPASEVFDEAMVALQERLKL